MCPDLVIQEEKYGDIETATGIARLRAMRTGSRYEVWRAWDIFAVRQIADDLPLSQEAEKLRTAYPDGVVKIW